MSIFTAFKPVGRDFFCNMRLEVFWAVINKVTVFRDVKACGFEDG